VDANTYEEFERRADEALQAGTQYILLDFKRVEYMSSRGLQVINHIFAQMRQRFPDVGEEEMRAGINAGTYKFPYLRLCNLSANVRKVFAMAGFDMYLAVHDSVDSAVAAF
jgi:anti-anti-sigma regulatory factor